jgi:hypothetical protein
MNKIEEQYIRIQKEKEANRATPNPLHISTILNDIENENLVVPEFQRDFEWNLDRFILLFDSIYRGYTIGNLLLWRTKEVLAHKNIGAEKVKTIDQIKKKEYTYVLDGQQRLTTLFGILRGKEISRFGRKPKQYKVYFDIKTDSFIKETQKLEEFQDRTIKRIIQDNEFDDFRFIDMSHLFNIGLNFPENLIKPRKVNLRNNLKNQTISHEEYCKEDEMLDKIESKLKKFKEIFEAYRIPQIVDFNDDIEKVVTVFERINTQNMQLDIYDIMVAKTYENIIFNEKQYTFNLNRATDKLLYKKEINENQLNPSIDLADDENLYYEIYPITLLRMLSIWINRDKKIALQKKDIYELKAQEIQDNIIPFRKLLTYIHNYCLNQLNLSNIDEDFTNNNILSLLTYVFAKKSYRESDTDLLNKWYWNSMIFNRFPGSQLQLMEKDISAFEKGDMTFRKIITQRRNTAILNDDYLLDNNRLINAGYNKTNSKIYQSCIILLNSLQPKDFDGKHNIDLINYIGKNTKNNKHHIIPYNSEAGKKIRKRYGKEKGEFIINNIANIVIISSEMNQQISKKNPKEYLQIYKNTPNFQEILKTHLIDLDMYNMLINEQYEEFLIARTNKIVQEIIIRCKVGSEELKLNESAIEEE